MLVVGDEQICFHNWVYWKQLWDSWVNFR